MDYSQQITLIDAGSPRKELNEPLGIEVLAGCLRKEVPSINVDTQWLQLTNGKLKNKNLVFNSGIIGISTKLYSLEKIKQLANEITEKNNNGVLVLGNLYGTFSYKEILDLYPNSICVLGEGEDAIVHMATIKKQNPWLSPEELKKKFWKQNLPNLAFNYKKTLVKTNRKTIDLNKAISPDRDFLDETIKKGGIVRIEGSRGCPYGLCKFCCITSKYAYRGWRPFPIKKIIRELEEISEAGGRAPYFTDEDFMGADPKRAIELSEQILQAKKTGRIDKELNFYIDLRANTVITKTGQKVIAKLQKAGLREIFLGIESGAPKQLERYGKTIVSNESARALAILKKKEIETDIGFIMFDLNSTLEDIKNNIEFIKYSGLATHDARLIKKMRVEPKTELARELIEKGEIKKQLNVDKLIYPFKFSDKKVQKIFNTFNSWEEKTSNIVYAIQALARGEMPSEKERKKLKAILGKFRKLDLEFLEKTLEKIEKNRSPALNKLRGKFEQKRAGIITKHYAYLEGKNKKLKRLLANYYKS